MIPLLRLPEDPMTNQPYILPRLIRIKDVPKYLGVDKNLFNKKIRPKLKEIRLSKQAIAFDRLDLDAWVEHYIACNGRPAK